MFRYLLRNDITTLFHNRHVRVSRLNVLSDEAENMLRKNLLATVGCSAGLFIKIGEHKLDIGRKLGRALEQRGQWFRCITSKDFVVMAVYWAL